MTKKKRVRNKKITPRNKGVLVAGWGLHNAKIIDPEKPEKNDR